MNANLLQQHAAFKKQAHVSSTKSAASEKPREPPKKRYKPDTRSVTNNPNSFKWIKLCVDRLRRRYQKERKPISLEELIKTIGLDLDPVEKAWLFNALKDNPKVHFDREKEKLSFKPSYPMHSKNDLLNILRENYDNGLGGILQDDVRECIVHADDIVEELKSERLLKTITRSDKKTIVYYRDTSVECSISEEFQELWNTISVREISENDIENYLKRVGIATMEGFGMKKASMKKKPAKRKRQVKILNSHLDSKILKEFD